MSYVKNYNPGQIRMDLPAANYIHELPLLSFGDIHGGVQLSLVFNYGMKAENADPFNIAPGYKLNLQKQIIFENGSPVAVRDENGNRISLRGSDFPYGFEDDSQRVLRTTGEDLFPYIIENADHSKEKYTQSGMIAAAMDKYGTTVLAYTYANSQKLASIVYRGSKSIQLSYYSSTDRLEYITFNGVSSRLTYPTNCVTIAHYSGVSYAMTFSDEMNFEAEASDTSVTYTTKLEKSAAANAITVTDRIGADIVNAMTYGFPAAPALGVDYNQVEITDYRGVKTRAQYQGKQLLYSYEVSGTDVGFVTAGTVEKYPGNVQIAKTIDELENSQFQGVQAVNDGTSMRYEGASLERWQLDVSGSAKNVRGYYLLTGWIRSKSAVVNQGDSLLYVSNSVSTSPLSFSPDVTPGGQWRFFAYKCCLSANSIYVRPAALNKVEMKDLRLTFQPTHVLQEGATTHTAICEDVLISGSSCIPLQDAVFTRGGHNLSSYGTVHFEDMLRYKINQKKGTNTTEFYCSKGRDVITANPVYAVMVESEGVEKTYLSNYHLCRRQYTAQGIITTHFRYDSSNRLICEVLNENGARISCRLMDTNLDTILSADEKVMVEYSRSGGLVTSEKMSATASLSALTAGSELYTRTTDYDTANTIKTTDEFNNQTVYTLDPVWGMVQSVTLPDGTTVTDTYDEDMCAKTQRSFGSRAHSYTYAGGNLSGLQADGISFGFTYAKGELASVSKNNALMEQHVHTQNSGTDKYDSYYPSQSGSLHSVSAEYDKYGRLTAVAGVLSHAYDVWPSFSATGGMTGNANNGSARLAMTTDLLRGEAARFTYNEKGLLAEKTVTDAADFAEKISRETFEYDDINRLTSHTATYDVADSKSVQGVLAYQKAVTDPAADSTVSAYWYKVNGVAMATTNNHYNAFGQLEAKPIVLVNSVFNRDFVYDKTRVITFANTRQSVNLGTHAYTYDSMGRIATDNYTSAHSAADGKAYTYDAQGQLVRENNKGLDKTFIYEYNNGNLTSIKAYNYASGVVSGTPVTTSFGYSADKLTSFGGTSIAYNAMGCPTTYDGRTATWTRGKLSRLFSGSLAAGSESYNYVYNANGQRVSRSYAYMAGTSGSNPVQVGQLTNCSRTYHYDHVGRLIAETVDKTVYGDGASVENIVYLYDDSGVVGMERTANGSSALYYFQRNLQGDVVAIYDANGNLKAKYLYDAWGNCTIASETTDYDVANANPIRYRGYYFDSDTGLYYLNARYYSPKWRRFISPNAASGLNPNTVSGLNLYVYAANSPVDITYNSLDIAEIAINGTIDSGGLSTSNSSISNRGAFFWSALPSVPNWLKHISKANDVFSATSHSAIVSYYLFNNLAFIDDMAIWGINPAKALGSLPKAAWLNKGGYVFAAIDAVVTYYDNRQQGKSWGEAIIDSALSFGKSTVSAWVGGVVGTNIGGWIGAGLGALIPIPGVGIVIGFVLGTAVGVVAAWFVDDVLGLMKEGLLDLLFD